MKTFGSLSAFFFLFLGTCLAQNNPRVAWGSSVYEYIPFPQAELSWPKAPAWLGGYRPINSTQWFWITGEAFTYSSWFTGEPATSKGNEDHIEIWSTQFARWVANTYNASNRQYVIEWTFGFSGPTSIPIDTPAIFSNNTGADFESYRLDFGDAHVIELPPDWNTTTNLWAALGAFKIILTGRFGTQNLSYTNQIIVTGTAFEKWKFDNFGTGFRSNPNASNDADPDGDGETNIQEYTAGTNPNDRNSVLKIDSATLSPTLAWNSVPGKTYRVLRAPTSPR